MFKGVMRIIDWVGPYKGHLFLGSLCSFFATWFTAGPIILTGYYISLILVPTEVAQPFGYEVIWQSLLILIVMIALRFFFTYQKCRLQESIGYEVASTQRIRVGDVLKRVSLGYFASVKTADILTGLTTELSALELDGMKMIDRVLNAYINMAAIVIMFLFLSPLAALVVVAGVAVSALTLAMINHHAKKNAPVAYEASEAMSKAALESVRGLSVIKSFGKAGSSMDGFRKACRNSKEVNFRIQRGFVPWNTAHMLSLKIASVALLFVVLYQGMQGVIGLTPMLSVALFSFTVFASIELVSDASHMLGVIESAMDKLDHIEKAYVIDQEGQDKELDSFDIVFDEVSFAYDDRPVIKEASFVIPENSTCAIVGPSGSGKSTLCSLLARFYDIDAGSIRVGGTDIREMTCDSLLRNISMVFQTVYLFQDSIKNNIRFGNPEATDAEIVAAAKQACCHDFIMKLPEGYDTVISEGGSTLSGGEKQRVSIARAILKDAPIVILDEATASIDPENERYIQRAINALTQGKTIITIAHRLATIEQADQILVVDDGHITQQGNHGQLIEEPGLYQRFVQIRQKTEGWSLA